MDGIVKQSIDAFHVYSEDYVLPMPARGGRGATRRLHRALRVIGRRRIESILIAQGEELFRRLAGRILESHGYSVLSPSDGDDALQLMRSHPDDIPRVLTDAVTLRIGGPGSVDKLHSVVKSTRIHSPSRNADNANEHHGTFDTRTAFIPRPFNRENLLDNVREVHDATS